MNDITLDSIFSEYNIDTALKIVAGKNAAPGLDGMPASELPEYWKLHHKAILEEIRRGDYVPTPLNLILMHKRGKKEKRPISVCTALDQMLQHCIRFELERYYTPRFHPHSYGFIKGRGTEDALKQCIHYMNRNLTYIVDADIRKCFDSIKHRIVSYRISRVSGEKVMDLIKKYLKNPSIFGDVYRYHRVGLPQGSCMSPVIANIVLNQLDWYLQWMRIPFVRYADDLLIFCKTRQDAETAMEVLESYLKDELSLRLNQEKTAIIHADELLFLGHAFCHTEGRYHLAIDDTVKNRALGKMEHHINKKSAETEEMLDRLGAFNRGWMNYYGCVHPEQIQPFLRDIEKRELEMLHKRIGKNDPDSNDVKRKILESKGFVLPSVWYDEIRERRDVL